MKPLAQAFGLGLLGFGVVYAHVVMFWQPFYAHHPWKGYERAAEQGRIQPHFTDSPWALAVCIVALVVLGAITTRLVHGRIVPVLISVCSGVFVAAIGLSLTTAEFRNSNLAPLAVVAYPLALFPPLVLGGVLGRAMTRRTRAGNAPADETPS